MDDAPVDESVAPLQDGDPRRLGSYELIGRLGVGAQGAVFLSSSASGDRVAIKLLHPDLTEDTDARGRFVREAMAATRVARFCAAQVIDVQVAGDRPYIVSEYVPGPSLLGLVREGGPLSGGALDRVAIGTATAVAAIHQAGIVHRDLKPANVLIGPDGPRVIDFGIAKALATTATTSSRVVGTPAYMAPEQLRGDPVDAAVDVFAWGAMIAFVATGRPPFGADTIPQVVQRIIAAEPDLTGLADPLRGLVRACLAKDAAARPTARQVLLRLLEQEEREEAPLPAATLAATTVAAATAALGVAPPAPAAGTDSAELVATRPALSRAFVVAGLAAVVVAIVALLLMAGPMTTPSSTPSSSPTASGGGA